MGVHTGDSITVAPAQTLTDKEYQRMRDASIAVLRKIGVDTGGSNVQFAVNPEDGRLLVIEMNPRVSRSSALASKATGFPIAKVAAKLAVGYTLDELKNEITGGETPASFEPTIDYVVTKIPRFTFEKFPQADGPADDADEVGRRGDGDRPHVPGVAAEGAARARDRRSTASTDDDDAADRRDRDKLGTSCARRAPSASATSPTRSARAVARRDPRADPHRPVVPRADRGDRRDRGGAVARQGAIALDAERLRELKRKGFSDRGSRSSSASPRRDVAHNAPRSSTCARLQARRHLRGRVRDARPPTCTRPTKRSARRNPTDREKIMVLGGGPNRIGQGIEFDYCCVHAAFALREDGFETIMVNCNPETVSTDYDTSDRLYFEPLTLEDVLEIVAQGEARRA